ncbi:MAG: segregation/condensation protein A [Chitinophagales bacterium]|nr:segregation/condensation protein A [Chitinophagales bacterium]
MSAPFIIHLPEFEGPFDLLLFFIERDELNIRDIPIHSITNDFLNYIHQLERLNIEVASEFMLVAATLMRIKAKMLLPRKEVDEEGNEIDPREELIQMLVEYKRFKEIVEVLKVLETERLMRFTRGNQKQEVKELINLLADEADLQQVTLFKLLKAFQKSLDKYKDRNEKILHKVVPYKYTLEEERTRLTSFIQQKGKASFKEVFETVENRVHAIFTFLGMLELIQQQVMFLILGEGYNNFWISSTLPEETLN